MAGYFRAHRLDNATANAQAKINEDIYDEIVERAYKEGMSASHYFRQWIYEGFERDFKRKKK